MTDFVAAGRHGITQCFRFSGRDSRTVFWFYALWLFIAQQLLSAVVAGALVAGNFGSLAGSISSSVADPPATIPYHFALFGVIPWVIVGSIVLIVALLAAAVSRRLHDSDLRGWWGLMPVPFLALSLFAMISLFSSLQQFSPRLFGAILLSNLIYLVALVVLVVLLCRPSTNGSNRFGERSI